MNSAENLCRKIIEEAEAAVAKKETEVQSEVSAILEAANGKARAIEKEASIEMKRRCDAYDERVNAVCQKAVRSAVLLEKARILDSVVADAEKALCALDGSLCNLRRVAFRKLRRAEKSRCLSSGKPRFAKSGTSDKAWNRPPRIRSVR